MADAGDGGEVVAAPTGGVLLVERSAAVHFKSDRRIFAQNIELAALTCAVAKEREQAIFAGVAKIQRQKVRLTGIYHSEVNYFTVVDDR